MHRFSSRPACSGSSMNWVGPCGRSAEAMDTMVQFGPERRLVGVLTGTPASSSGPIVGPIVVLPSAGLLPRAGPFRLHVELSRRLARQGVSSFRFDVPGVGEAPRLKGCGGRGGCSAADVAWGVALADPRVCGVLMLDGLSYTGPWFQLALATGVLRRPVREWPSVVRRLLGRMQQQESERAPVLEDYRDWPERPQARSEFARLVARDVRSLWVYTGGYTARFRHPRQFAWSFGGAANDRRVAMHYWPDCDHTFFARAHRERLLDTVERWLLNNFPTQPLST